MVAVASFAASLAPLFGARVEMAAAPEPAAVAYPFDRYISFDQLASGEVVKLGDGATLSIDIESFPSGRCDALDGGAAVHRSERREDQEYFADGLSEELLNVLAKIRDLRVASRTSAFHFKGKDVDIPTVAQSLNVATILEGSVRKAGRHVRITAQLMEVGSDSHLVGELRPRTRRHLRRAGRHRASGG